MSVAAILSRVLGTNEPAYADPDFALVSAADDWRARIEPEALRRRVEGLPSPRSRLHAPEAMEATDRLLTDAWRAAGWRVGRQRLTLRDVHGVLDYTDPSARGGLPFHTYPELEGLNVVAIAEGTTDEAVVAVAHHDTVRGSPGADDNGAGLAILLEVAEQLAGRRFQRTVILAAPDYEEIGMVGSRSLVAWLKRRYDVVGALVFDPIGYMNPAAGTQRVPPGLDRLYPGQLARLADRGYAGDTVVGIYRGSSTRLAREWARCLASTIGRERVLLVRDPLDARLVGPLLVALPAARNFSRSDHVRFWHAGLPAVQATNTANFRNPNYHLPSDTPDTLDYDTLARITASTVLFIERMADPR